ncbi:response regulator [Halosolutus gelatinilyticus]|uniref:response regulator n=1 Tax=Halosolutus gelatinilyticus TaxID=2931975 RepID=UPI001FF19A9D|nr:response regulator [Halosolutus gelatinilyticus]
MGLPSTRGYSYDILLIESDPADARRFRKSFEALDAPNTLHVTSDAADALEFVRRNGEFSDEMKPDLVLLDPDVPEGDGYELLTALKADPIPVIVIARTDEPAKVEESYRRYANAYLVKPTDRDRFDDLVRQIGSFWLGVAKLPGTSTRSGYR